MRELTVTHTSQTSRARSALATRVFVACALMLSGCATDDPVDDGADSAIDEATDSLTLAYDETQCGSCAEWNVAQEPFTIFGNSYYVGTAGLAAVLITSDSGHVLIDGGLPNSAPLIRDNIRALGFDVSDVKLILNSHAHFDHSGGIAALQSLSGARVAALPQSADMLRRGNSDVGDPQHPGLLDFPSIDSVEALTDGVSITVGGLTLTPHATPAHVPGGTTWSWRSCSGDQCMNVVYGDSQSIIAAEGFRFSERSDLDAVERGFVMLEQLPCDILITPHPGASALWERRGSPTGFVDPTACSRYAASARERLRQRLAVESPGPQ